LSQRTNEGLWRRATKTEVALRTPIAGSCTDEPEPFVIFTGQNNRENSQHFFFYRFCHLLTLYVGAWWQAHIYIIALHQFLVNSPRNKHHTKDSICLFFCTGKWLLFSNVHGHAAWISMIIWEITTSSFKQFLPRAKGDGFVLLNDDCLPESYLLFVVSEHKIFTEALFSYYNNRLSNCKLCYDVRSIN